MKLKTKSNLMTCIYMLVPACVCIALVIWPELWDDISQQRLAGAWIAWIVVAIISRFLVIRCPQSYCGQPAFFTPEGRSRIVLGDYCPWCGQAFEDKNETRV